jgi:hypothetical protein
VTDERDLFFYGYVVKVYFLRSAAICTIESNDSGVQTTAVSTIESNESGATAVSKIESNESGATAVSTIESNDSSVEPTAVNESMNDEQIREMFRIEDRKKDISSLTNEELAVYQLFPDMPMRSELPKFGPGKKAKSLVYTMKSQEDIIKDKANSTWKRFWYVEHSSKIHINSRTMTEEELMHAVAERKAFAKRKKFTARGKTERIVQVRTVTKGPIEETLLDSGFAPRVPRKETELVNECDDMNTEAVLERCIDRPVSILQLVRKRQLGM